MVRDGFKPGESEELLPAVIYELPVYKRRITKVQIIVIVIVAIVLAIGIFLFKTPTIILKGDKIENVSFQNEFVDSGIIALYHGRDVTDTVISTNNVNTQKLGEYEIKYEVPYWFGTYTYTRKVMVVDDVPPAITLEGEQEHKNSYSKEYKELGYKAVDNCDGDITDKVEVEQKEISELEKEIHYKVSDNAGNIQEIVRKVIIVDDIKPELEINGDGNVFLNVGEEYKEQGAEAVDEKDGNLTDKIEISGNVDTSKEGIYNVLYKVSDSKSNQATVTRQVVVGGLGKASMNVGTPGNIYLTFDDGPTTSTTTKILDTLKEKGVKATFFIIDYSAKTEALVKRIVEEGHSIAIHGGSHEYSVAYASEESYLNDLDYMKQKIKKSTGVETNLIRFLGGSSNTISRNYCEGVMSTLATETVRRGYRYYDWNVASGDSGDATTPQNVYDNVVKGLKQTRSNIVLMHDFGGNDKTVEALPAIIEYGLNNGYTFDRITNKTPMVMQNIQN